MSARTVVAAAAPLWVRDHVEGPRQRGVVVHSGPHAVYAAVSHGATTRCVGVLSARGSFVPCGMRTTWPDLSGLFDGTRAPSHGDVVSIGGGSLELGSVSVRIGRTVDASVPSLDAASAGAMADALRSVLGGREGAVRSELSPTSLELLADADSSAVTMLLGRGSGLTPVGDDVLCGWLAVMAAARPGPSTASTGAASGRVSLEVAEHASRATTTLSATLLERAISGDVLPEFRHLLLHLRRRVAGVAPDQLDTAVDRLLAVGHSSGAGILLGCLLALDHLTQIHPKVGNPRS